MNIRTLYLPALSVLLILFTLALGASGLLAGMLYGGNYGCIEYNGLGGYEACGTLGMQIGLVIGVVASVIILVKSYKKLKRYEQSGKN